MARSFRAAILIACLLTAGRAFAAGGSCPSAANYLNATTEKLVTLSSLGVTSCYYVAANGADTNAGTSEASPWMHAPGMPNCVSTCASVTPVAGEGFILRGGDTWHFGNSALTPYTGLSAFATYYPACGQPSGNMCGWYFHWAGTSSNPIYIGVDQGWYSGGSWTRPVMNGDNPLSTTSVANCTYDDSTVMMFSVVNLGFHLIIDNFEWTGVCWSGPDNNAGTTRSGAAYVNMNQGLGAGSYNTFQNNYIHGWTHVTFNCVAGNPETGNCQWAQAVDGGPSPYADGDVLANNVVDGSDSDDHSYVAFWYGGYDVHDNVIRHIGTAAVLNNNHTFHDNLIEYVQGNTDGVAHGNAVEFNTEWNGNNVVYNNVFRDEFGYPGTTGCGNIQFQQAPRQNATDYTFNNLIYNYPCGNGNYWDLCSAPKSDCINVTTATVNLFNNTWVMTAGYDQAWLSPGAPSTLVANWYNNHCIIPGGGAASACFWSSSGTINYLTDVVQDTTVASGQGYTSSEPYAYSPTSASNATVIAGTNEKGYCSALTGSSDADLQAAGIACQSDTGYACTYNSTNHTVSCPARTTIARPTITAWDAGAYQLSGSQAQGPQPPTNLQSTVY